MFKSTRRRNRPAVRPGRRQAARLACERLEQRCLLNATVVGDLWLVRGTRRADNILLTADPDDAGQIQAVVNGNVVAEVQAAAVSGIRVMAGPGGDTVRIDRAVTLPATLKGGRGHDTLVAGGGQAELRGGPGRDSLQGGPGSDRLLGGPGSDQLNGGAGHDRLNGGAADDSLDGGAGHDLLRGGPGSDQVEGGRGPDRAIGNSGHDTLRGGAGRDRIRGGGGRDRLFGGPGNDRLFGGRNDDILIGNGMGEGWANGPGPAARAARPSAPPDNDLLDGGPGRDLLNGSGGRDRLRNGREYERLHRFQSCQELQQAFIDYMLDRYEWYFDEPPIIRPLPGGIMVRPAHRFAIDFMTNADFTTLELAGQTTNQQQEQPGYSETNTQVAGVDEADIVETDGQHVFVLRGRELIVLDAWPAADSQLLWRGPIEGRPVGMYLQDGRLAVISRISEFIPIGPFPVPDPGTDPPLTIFADLWRPPVYDKPQVKVTLFDVTDAASPTVVQESYLDGRYVSSRRIDNRIYLVSSWHPILMPWYYALDDGDLAVESPEHFQQRLQDVDLFLPQFKSLTHAADGVQEQTGDLLGDCGDVYQTPDGGWETLTTVTTLDMGQGLPDPVDSTTIIGSVDTVYASASNLYLVKNSWWGDGATAVHKVALGDDVQVVASGEVPGRALNQFSVDEYVSSDGVEYLRIATTSGGWRHRANNVFVMSQEWDSLNVIGSAEDIAPGERIMSARFLGEQGYLVTFRQVDPLFTLDLSNPEKPEVIGELEIPGFSGYLQLIDDNHLLGIGRGPDPDPDTGRGLQLSLFDVSDLSSPQLVDRYVVRPDSGAWSAAQWDHHAVGYYPEYQTLAIPVSAMYYDVTPDDGSGNNTVADQSVPAWEPLWALWVFDVDTAAGFDLAGRIDHSSAVQRSLRIGNVLYSVSTNTFMANQIEQPYELLASVDLAPSDGGPVPVPVWLM